ncbi:hypothetical protein [Spirobacillus cienkowskii]|uniref:hypothetical protein n=1 Tax=Spirobacillus cienkowskii TaxID=495820 RepID=UPI0030D52CE5
MLKKFFILILLVIAVLIGVGAYLPAQRSVTLTHKFNYPVRDVFEFITQIDQSTWRSDLEYVKIISNEKGREVWIEKPKKGMPIKFETKALVPYQRFEIVYSDEPRFSGVAISTFKAIDNNSTEVIFSETLKTSSIISKLFSYMFFDLEKFMKKYLIELEAALEKRKR